MLLKLKKVPVDIQDYESDADEYADLIADNRIAELSETDYPLLKDLVVEIDTGAIDIEIIGYDEIEIEDMLTAINNPWEDVKGLTKEVEKDNECPKCGYQW